MTIDDNITLEINKRTITAPLDTSLRDVIAKIGNKVLRDDNYPINDYGAILMGQLKYISPNGSVDYMKIPAKRLNEVFPNQMIDSKNSSIDDQYIIFVRQDTAIRVYLASKTFGEVEKTEKTKSWLPFRKAKSKTVRTEQYELIELGDNITIGELECMGKQLKGSTLHFEVCDKDKMLLDSPSLVHAIETYKP